MIRPDKEKENAVIEILVKKASVEAGPVPSDLAGVSDVLTALDGEVQSVAAGDHVGFRLLLPLK